MSFFLLTGVTSGIGSVVLCRCLADGHTVCAVVRSDEQRQRLRQAYPDNLDIEVAELADRVQVSDLVARLQSRTFDYVLLNAGCAQIGAYHEQSMDDIDTVMQANLLSNMQIVHGLLPMIRRQRARVIFVSSIVARVPGRDYAAYAVSKAGLSHFYAALSLEYPEIPMLCVEIGPVHTDFHEKAKLQLESRRGFKAQDLIGNRLYDAMLRRTGVTTLAFDWACGRLLLMSLEDIVHRVLRRRSARRRATAPQSP